MEKINPRNALEPKKNLYTPRHLLADELSRHFGETKKFAMYLGIVKKIGIRAGRRLFSEVKQSRARKPVKLFMYKVKQYNLNRGHLKNAQTGNRKKQ